MVGMPLRLLVTVVLLSTAIVRQRIVRADIASAGSLLKSRSFDHESWEEAFAASHYLSRMT